MIFQLLTQITKDDRYRLHKFRKPVLFLVMDLSFVLYCFILFEISDISHIFLKLSVKCKIGCNIKTVTCIFLLQYYYSIFNLLALILFHDICKDVFLTYSTISSILRNKDKMLNYSEKSLISVCNCIYGKY